MSAKNSSSLLSSGRPSDHHRVSEDDRPQDVLQNGRHLSAAHLQRGRTVRRRRRVAGEGENLNLEQFFYLLIGLVPLKQHISKSPHPYHARVDLFFPKHA